MKASATEQEMKQFLDRLLPDKRVQETALKALAATIRQAHELNPAAWSLSTRLRRVLTLSVGRIFVMDIRPDRISLALGARQPSEAVQRWLATAIKEGEPFRSVPTISWFSWPQQDFADAWPDLMRAHAEAVTVVAQNTKRTPYFHGHAPDFIEFLSETLSEPIPQPTFRQSITPKMVEEMVGLVRQEYPGWSGFQDPKFEDDETTYKRKASDLARTTLSREELHRLNSQGDHDEVVQRLKSVASATNLLFLSVPAQGDLALLQQLEDPAALTPALIDLLHGPDGSPERLDRFVRWADEKELPNKWTLPTYLMFLVNPEDDLFVKPETTTAFVKHVGRPESFRGTPSAEKYLMLLDLTQELGQALGEYSPRDMIDLQGFIWVVAQQSEERKKKARQKTSTVSAETIQQLWARYPKHLATDSIYQEWRSNLIEFLQWLRSTPVPERATLAFQQRLWEENPISSVGMGSVPTASATEDPEFRQWTTQMSDVELPADASERSKRILSIFEEFVSRFAGYGGRIPRLKIKRVMASFFPRDLTTITSYDQMNRLAKLLLGKGQGGILAHVQTVQYLNSILGSPEDGLESTAERLMFPWFLCQQLMDVEESDDDEPKDECDEAPTDPSTPTTPEIDDDSEDEDRVVPSLWKGELPPFSEIYSQVAQAGQFDDVLVQTLHAGLWAHPRRHFAILTGLSGAGKTLLARAYGLAIAGASDYPESPDRYLLTVAVQPGWSDPGALLGYANPLRANTYVRTPALDFLLRCLSEPERAFTLVLDEMNLSHPEQYLAPLLSAMETGAAIELHGEGRRCGKVPSRIPYPPNLVLIGTVNMDETTHGLSDKVLDRALTLEFWKVDVRKYPKLGGHDLAPETESHVLELLHELTEALSPARLHFGWRVVDEVFGFVASADSSVNLPLRGALDEVVYAKVLPKLRGDDSPRFRDALNDCETVLSKYELRKCRRKIEELRNDLESIGSARFWR